jgi:hypothetical protein
MVAKKQSGTAKNLDLGPLMDRVRKIAAVDPVLNTGNAVIRAAVAKFCDEWEQKAGQGAPAGAEGP